MMELSGLVDSCRLYAVAAEVPEDGNALQLYFHDGDGFRIESLPFRRFAVLSDRGQITVNAEFTELDGHLPLGCLAEFDSAADHAKALAELRESRRPWMNYRDPVRQALMRCRVRLFSGMEITASTTFFFITRKSCAEGLIFVSLTALINL